MGWAHVSSFRIVAVALAALAVLSGGCGAETPPAAPTRGVAAGERVYPTRCATCPPFGAAARLDAAVVSRYPTEAQLASYLRRGSPTMPGFGMDQIDLRGLRDLVGYLRALP